MIHTAMNSWNPMHAHSLSSLTLWSAAIAVAALTFVSTVFAQSQDATIIEAFQTFRTYPFSDPDPVARMSNIYPYFRFHGYSMTPVDRSWKIVTLENRWIRILIAPEIGGKILGAFEKSTGRAFIYFNKVIKFREIAMRGPWTSGGIEFNFGDIGHTPTTSTPVDYVTKTNPDGSVSCIVGALDLPSRTEWRVEIRLPRDKAMFETRSYWYNPTPVTTSLYHWMNAAADADSTLQVIYPGTAYIGHAGETGEWPVDRQGRDLSWYRNNAFGSYKSYHVLGSHTDYFGARWNNFGVIHWSRYTDKPGKKLWIWGLSREGEIWKDLLTDPELGNTQYVELQSGLHFNQAMMQSSRTPFKHMAFLPQTSERFSESWFPFRDLGGVTQATPDGVLEVSRSAGILRFAFCPTGSFTGKLIVVSGGNIVLSRDIHLEPLNTFRDSVRLSGLEGDFEIHAGNVLRYRSVDERAQVLERPIQGTDGFNWGSAYGLSVDGRERVRQRDPEGALVSYRAALEVDSTFLPALAGAAELYIRKVEYDSALIYAKRGLAIDAYDPETNYVYGLVQRHRGKRFDAMDGFGIASRSVTYRTAALVQLAEMAIVDNQWANAAEYALRASQTDAANIPSLQLLSILARRAGDTASAVEHLRRIDVLDPLSHFARFERYRLSPTEQNRNAFTSFVRNELPHESYLELASLYVRLNLLGDGREVLLLAPKQPMVDLWLGYIADRMGRPEESKQYVERAVAASPAFAFPHRWEDLEVLRWARGRVQHWKISYYLALLSWSLGRSRDAEVYFAECGESPDFAPFYLTRAGFRADRPELALADYRRARAVGPDEWRTYNALATFCIDRGEHREALKVCVEAVERFPQSYVLTFLLARALLMNGQHRQSLAILDTLSILPFEGARFGRDAYRQACLIGALDTLRGRHMDAALALIARARLWPERLGAGRPYDVDERFEDFLEYRIFRAKGDEQRARRSLERVAEYSRIHADANSPSNLIGALALRDAGRFAEGRDLLVRWAEREPADDFVRWAREVFEGRGAQAVGLLRNMRARFWHGTARDKEAGLVATLVVEMR